MPESSPPRDRHVGVKERRLPFGAPVRAWTMAEWALLPLRIFLGVTFAYAGLQKLANPNFFHAPSPISIQAQLIAASHTSPLRGVLIHLIQFAKPVGVIIAFAEFAVGLGIVFGLWTRVAALGGAVLSLSLFLTVSFHASPYFTGADIVFLFAWLPFIVAGGGSQLSLDGWIAARSAKKGGVAPSDLVAIPFATVQRICGHFDAGNCSAREGLDCDAAVCPVLLGERAPALARVEIDSIDRRALAIGAAAVAGLGATALIFGDALAYAGKRIGDAVSPKNTTRELKSSGVSTGQGTLLGPVKDLPSDQAATFTIPSSGDPGIVINLADAFYAYDAVCPHAGCTVGYYAHSNLIVCPCHGSEFAVTTGAVIDGPAPHGLLKLKVTEGADGNLYLQ